MQGAESENQTKSRSDEEINFRPSPNFKHMKKYLKSKFEENQMESPPPHEEAKLEKAAPVVQPPLPPNPPPPDSPTIINLKKEIEDDEYHDTTTESASDAHNPMEELLPEQIKTDKSEVPEKANVIMCRNFARGTCKKGASCIFAHELILSQLSEVYTFCRNFQNSVCTLPKCKFVHATVFEKEYFYRTGYLPPHTLAHLKEGNNVQPPPPPPNKVATAEMPQVFASNHPPPPPPAMASSNIPVVVLSSSSIETNQSPKRDWPQVDEFGSPSLDVDTREPLTKKCKHCDSNEFRYQYNKNKCEELEKSTEEIKKKNAEISKKSLILYKILASMFKPLKPTLGVSAADNEKEQAMFDHLKFILLKNYKNEIHTNAEISSIMAKLLRNNGGATPDHV